MTTEYPKRGSYFAYKVIRMMGKMCAAQIMGPEACWLVTIIANLEDVKRYTEPVTFFNEQLMPISGFNSKNSFARARKKAIGAGWLHYTPGGKGVAGSYWALIPDRFKDIPDTPFDEGFPVQNSTTNNTVPPQVSGAGSHQERDGKRTDNGTANGPHSYPIPNPIPSPQEEGPAPATAGCPASKQPPPALLALIAAWNALGPSIVKLGNGAESDPPSQAVLKGWAAVQKSKEARPAFDDLEKLMTAIRKARFCHGEDWFDLTWLLTKNQRREWKVLVLLRGGYDRRRSSQHELPLTQGAGQIHPEDTNRGTGIL